MAGGKVHEHGNPQVRHQVEEEVLEVLLLGSVERQLAKDDAGEVVHQPRGAEVDQPLVDDGHRVARLFDEEDRSRRVHLVVGADRLLHEREIAADQPAGGLSGQHGAREVLAELRRGPGDRQRADERSEGRIAHARREIVDGRAVERAQATLLDEPEVQRGDVGVADEGLRVEAKDGRLQVRQHAHGAIAAGPADDRVHSRVEPHAHETLGTALVFAAREPAHLFDLGVENDGEPRALERLHAAHQPALLWRIRGRDDADRVAFDQGLSGEAACGGASTAPVRPSTSLRSDWARLPLERLVLAPRTTDSSLRSW